MIGVLGFLLRNWRLALGGLAVLFVGGVILYQGYRIRYLIVDRATMGAALVSYRETLDATQRAHRAEIDALKRERDAEKQRTEKTRLILEGMVGLEDGPIAPVLRYAIDRLRDGPAGGETGLPDNPRATD